MRRLTLGAMALLAAAPAAPAQTRVADFTFVDRSDVGQLVIYTPASNRSGYLAWACVHGALRVYLSPDRALGDRYEVPVDWDFDRGGAHGADAWDLTTDGRGAYAPQAAIEAFTAAARLSNTVVIALDGKQEYNFRLGGLGEALDMLPCAQAPQTAAASLGDE